MAWELWCFCHPARTVVIWEGMATIKDSHHSPCLKLDVNNCSAVPQKKCWECLLFSSLSLCDMILVQRDANLPSFTDSI